MYAFVRLPNIAVIFVLRQILIVIDLMCQLRSPYQLQKKIKIQK